jgi:hypothetical protein
MVFNARSGNTKKHRCFRAYIGRHWSRRAHYRKARFGRLAGNRRIQSLPFIWCITGKWRCRACSGHRNGSKGISGAFPRYEGNRHRRCYWGRAGTRSGLEFAFTTEVSAAKSAQIAVNDANIQAAKSIAAERLEAEQLTDILKDENQSRKEKEVALKKLKSINADYFGDLTIEKSKVEDITGALNKYNEQLLARARITATTNKLIEVEQKLLDTQQQFEDADPTIFQTVANFVTSGGKAYAFAAKQAGDFTENLNENTGKLTAQKAALEAQLKSLTATGAAVETVTKNYEKLNVTPKGDAPWATCAKSECARGTSFA